MPGLSSYRALRQSPSKQSESVIQVAKYSRDNKLSSVSSVYSRGPEFKEFYFQVNDDALPEIIGEERAIAIAEDEDKTFDKF